MDEETLDIREYANTLLARWWILALGPLVAVLVALGIFLATPVPVAEDPEYQALEYQATTKVLMGGSVSLSLYPDLVKSSPVLEEAISGLALSMSVAERRSKLSVSDVDSQMVRIQATDSDPTKAARLADGVAQSYIGYLDNLGEPRLAAAREELAQSLAALETGGSAEAVGNAVAVLTSRATPAIVLAPAEVLQEPSIFTGPPSHLARNTTLAAVLGFILAVLVIFLLEYIESPVRSPAQIERRFGLSNLGSVPRWRKSRGPSSSLLVRLNSETGLSESVSQVAASLDFTATACQTKTVAVTSPGRGDGRSSLVACLGVALSEQWRQVILVDTDFRHPSLHSQFDLDNSLGLSNLLSNPDLDLADVVQSTNYPRLQVITSGTIPANPTNLVRCPRMSWFLERVKESADLVLIDTSVPR